MLSLLHGDAEKLSLSRQSSTHSFPCGWMMRTTQTLKQATSLEITQKMTKTHHQIQTTLPMAGPSQYFAMATSWAMMGLSLLPEITA